MGKAHQAPDATYRRHFVVSAHAVERYRERVEKEHAARSDFDLANLIDERVRASEKHQTVLDTRACDAVTRVFQIEHRDRSIYFAVVRDMTVVTILDEDMLKANFDNGSWKTGPVNMAFADKLRGVTATPSAPKLAVIAQTPAPNTVADASLALGNAMVAQANAMEIVSDIDLQIEKLNNQRVAAVEMVSRADADVTAAQAALSDAVHWRSKRKD